MGSAISVLSGVAILTVFIGHATESWRSAGAGWGRAGGGGGNTDIALADVAVVAIGIGLAANTGDGAIVVVNWCGRGEGSISYKGQGGDS